ncbi:hypothetical protein Rsub_02180 [Raphidocelis subcapitata]|uniref:Fibronectin type-III domain-containing protein n=1 Tax=Raphidocelis subcapitata TaxID=307507 RepID=A0A2V0NUS7_9CHLO|nr:hypothetical protein Rsub_02180 [Raphidocelis subcapitata]|eukprot:GBF89303.1 hypothetical protein Rsub_02180 [Raphidocelis subcapitata]
MVAITGRTGSAAFAARLRRRWALLLALLVLAQLLATAHGKREPRPTEGGALQVAPLAGAGEPAAPSSGRRLPQRFRDPALAEADALARIAANQPADLIVSFKVRKSDIKQQESQIANSLGLVAGDVATPAAAEPLRREARMRANEAVKLRVLSQRAARKGARLKRDFAMLPVALLSVNSSVALEALQSDPSVASIEPRIVFTIAGRGLRDLPPLGLPPERGFGGGAVDALGVDGGGGGRRRLLLEESLLMIGAPEAAAAGYTGKGCAVAVIDTGADYTQPDLGSCTEPGTPAATCRVSVARDFHLDGYDDGELDDNGHGTNVAAIVAQAATESQIIALDVFRWFDDSSGGPFFGADYADIVGAIDWVLEKKDELGVCVINLSLGSPCQEGDSVAGCPACPDRAIAQALASARAAGVLAAVASGNDGLSTGLSIPACAPAAVSVGAVYDAAVSSGLQWGDDPVTCTDPTNSKEQIACFSNSAGKLTVLAPGAANTGGGNEEDGTSQATPHVAATLAVLRAAFPTATMDATVEALATTGKPLTDPRNGVTKPLINMLQAANQMAEGASIPVGTVRINGGAQWTSSRIVALAIQAAGATQMCVASEAAAPCTAYEPYATSKVWQLPEGDGDKSVRVYFRNAVNETGEPAMATITLDSTPPVNAALTINGGVEFTSSPQVTLAISGTDTYPAGLQMCVANNNNTASGGCSPYEPFALSNNHTLPDGYGPKTVFLWLQDAAGNTASAQATITLLVPPNGSVVINGGAPWTNIRNVTLNITAGEGVTEVCVNASVGAATCVPRESGVEAYPWQLSGGDGEKSVFVYFRNAGNETGEPAMATITLDSTPPANANLTINSGAEWAAGTDVTLTISGTDNNPASLQMCVANNDTGSGGCSSYKPFETSKNHTLSPGYGPKTVFLWLRDAAGNTASAQATITLLVPPNGSVVINGGAPWTNIRNVTLNITAGEGVTEVCVNASVGAATCVPRESGVEAYPWQLSGGDGEKSVFVYFRNAGNETGEPAIATITLDSTPPVNANLTINGGAAFTLSPQVTLAIGGTDTYSAGLLMCVANNNNTGSGGCSPYVPFETSTNHTLPDGYGPKTVFLWLRDAAGNTASAEAQITLVFSNGSVVINGGADWTNIRNVTLNITAGEGITEACVSNTELEATACQFWVEPAARMPWQLSEGDGKKTVFVYFRNAGNVTSGPASDTITLDSTPPVNATLTINRGAAFTSSPQVTLAIGGTNNNSADLQMCVANNNTGSDDCSLYEPFAATKNHTLPAGAGPKTVFLWLQDAAGNTASAQATITLLVPPNGSVVINEGAPWTNIRNVTLNITAGEGITEVCVANAADCAAWEATPAEAYPWQLSEGDGKKTVFVYFRNAGNETSAPATATTTLDSTPPVNASLAINGGAEWAAGTDVNLTIGGSDTYPAGLRMCLSANQTAAGECKPYEAFLASKPWQLLAGEGERTVFLWLRDAAGNSAGASASIKLDTQAPSGVAVSINGNATETVSLDVSVAITASDFSGVARMCIKTAAGAPCSEGDFVSFISPAPVKLPAGALGARYVYVTLRDARGNTMSAPASDQITYNDPSVPSNVTVSVANANSNGWVTSSDVRIAVSGAGAASVTEICVREEDAPCTAFSPFVNPMPYILSPGPDGNRTLFVTLRAVAPPANSTLGGGNGLTLPLGLSVDLNPPTDTSISLSSGTGVVATPVLSLVVAAKDVSGVKGLCITAEPEATAALCDPWQEFNAIQSFTLPSSEGTSKVLAFFRDTNGHTSAGVAASVTIDTSKPKARRRDMDLKTTRSSSSVTLTWSKDGATDDISDVSGFFVLYRRYYTPNSCKSKGKRTRLVNAAIGAGGTVTATVKGLKPGRRYGFRVCAVDAAGNVGGGVTKHASTKSARGNKGNR